MARVVDHSSIEALEDGLRSASDLAAARHFQVIWLLAKGHTIAEGSEVTTFVPRWIEQLIARYNAEGSMALGDRRRHNRRPATVLTPELLERLRERLAEPPLDRRRMGAPNWCVCTGRARSMTRRSTTSSAISKS